MKITIKAQIIIETEKYDDIYGWKKNGNVLTMDKIKQELNNKKCKIQWINSELNNDPNPVLIIKI
jgi:hypothetical protein